MPSLEQETVSGEDVPVLPMSVMEHNTDLDVKDTSIENTLEKTSLEAPPTGVVSEKEESREEDPSQDTSEVEKETKISISQVQDSPSNINRDQVEEGAGQGRAAKVEAPEAGQDAPRWSSSAVEVYAIQCNSCFKWRIMPSKENYEALREHILEKPFVCAKAQEWRENMTCDDPADIDDNEPTVLWAVDKHDIPCPPKGFPRRVVLRAENAKKFADVYYTSPCGKTLRSMVQVQKYLDEHPELGVRITQFSFTSPKGRTDASGAGVSTKRPLNDETQSSTDSRKRIKGSGSMPPRSRPLTGEGHAKSKKASDSGPHPKVGVKMEKLEPDRKTG